MLAIIDNVLEFSRIESGKAIIEESAVETGSVFDSCVVMFHTALENKHRKLTIDKEITYPYTYLDVPHITEIILNIISNGIKYTGEGGLIQCKIRQIPDTDERCITEFYVEDNELNAEIALELLGEQGLIIDRVYDGVECVDKLEKSPDGLYGLILMDIQMPIMDGYEATKKIRRLDDVTKANIPIIAMTANAFAEDKQKALEVGMNGHVAKPIDMSKLIPLLEKFL